MLPRITRAVAGLAMIVAGSAPTRADQAVAPPTIDEVTFVRRVLERSPRRLVHDARRQAANAAINLAGVLPNPTLIYEREAVPGLDASDDFLRIGWTLDVSGRRGLARSAARAASDAEHATIDRDGFLLEIDARIAYLEAAHARQLVVTLDDSRAGLAAIVDTLRSRATRGDASSYDADRATLELDTLDDERADAQRSLQIAQLRLGALLGEPAAMYTASDSITLPPLPPAGPLEPTRTDVDAARARAREADRELAGARRAWVPRFELVVGVMSSTSSSGDGLGYVVGIGGDLPLFDRGNARAERHHADAKRWQREATALANDAQGEAEQARRDLTSRIAQARAYAAGPAKLAVDLQRRATVAYREGDRPILELLDVQRSARHAVVRELALVYEARRADLGLRRALGRNP